MPRSGIVLCIVLLAWSAAGALAAVRPAVDNAAAAEGVRTALLSEQWRAGGIDDDEIFFGNIAAARADGEGNVLLLDSQLSRVMVISPQGELTATLGREGDGPGEVRRPGDMFQTPDGTLCLLQSFPGRIVRLHRDGTPAGDGTYSTGSDDGSRFVVLVVGLPHPDGMVLGGIRMTFAGTGQSVQDYFLSVCNGEGVQQTQLLTKRNTIDYGKFELSESGMDFIWSRCAVAADGTVFAAPERNEYRIEAFAGSAEPALVFSRTVTVPDRTSAQKQLARKVLEGIGSNYPVKPLRYIVEDTPPVIRGLWTTDDGLLWVQTGTGINTPPPGCWEVLDVFDGQGSFVRQVALPGEFDPQRDGLFILRDGRLLVITGALDAFLGQQAVGGDDSTESGADPLEVICYDMDLN